MNNLLVAAIFCFSTFSIAYGSGDMFLDLPKDSNVSSLNDRHYSASLGRFLTPDKAKISISEYTYNNVVLSSDPSGLGLWSEFKRIIRGTKITSSDFPAHFDKGFDRDVARDGAAPLKRENSGTHGAPVKDNQETVPSTVAIIPDPQIGTGTPPLIDNDYASWGDDNETSDALRQRLRTHNSPESLNAYPAEYNPEWSRPSIYTHDIDFSVSRVKGHTANISSDDDLGSPVGTASNRANRLNRTKSMPIFSVESDIDMIVENTQAAEFNTSTGLVGSLTKNKKVLIASGVVALSVGGAALTTYEVLKHKPAFSPPPVEVCPGMIHRPAPC